MHSSTLDSQNGCVLSTDRGNVSSSDGGELLISVIALVTEGRIPRKAAVSGLTCTKDRGFYEGPHCALRTSQRLPSSLQEQTSDVLSLPSVSTSEHCCSPNDILCQEYHNIRKEVINLWEKGIPLCIEIFLKNTCCNASSLESTKDYLLMERWYFTVSQFRSSDVSSTLDFNQLISAIRSQLYFSQISAWLSKQEDDNTSRLSCQNFHYRLAIPGETFGASKFTIQANTHEFPITDLGNGHTLKISLHSLPRVTTVPNLKCSKCCATLNNKYTENPTTNNNLTTTDKDHQCSRLLFDDRMHTRCTLKGKHRCDDFDELDNSVKEDALLGKYKRLCNANIDVNTSLNHRHAQGNSDKMSNGTTCCHCCAFSPSNSSPLHSKEKQGKYKQCSHSHIDKFSFNRPSTSKLSDASSPVDCKAKMDNTDISQDVQKSNCFKSNTFNLNNTTQTLTAPSEDMLNQNEKRNSVQNVEEPHKAPKLDIALTSAEISEVISVLQFQQSNDIKPNLDLYQRKDTTPKPRTTQLKTGEHLMNTILRSCRLQNKDDVEHRDNDNTAASTSKCDVKCVQKLGRIGTSFLNGCAKALQGVSDTNQSDILNLSNKVNVYIDFNECDSALSETRPSSKYKACKMRDISNTHQSKSTAITNTNTIQTIKPSNSLKLNVSDESNQQFKLPQAKKVTGFNDSLHAKISPNKKSPSSSITCSGNDNCKRQFDSPIPNISCSRKYLPSSSVCKKIDFTSPEKTLTADYESRETVRNNLAIEIPSLLDKNKFRKSLDSAASMVFHSRTGLPLTSSPAPVRRGNTCFDYDSRIDSVSAIKSALFSSSFSTDDDSESDGSIVSPCSPDNTKLLHHSKHRHHRSATVKWNRRSTSSNLLGTFEESVLNGRLEPVATVHGFKAELGASGSFVPRHLVVPVTVFFYTLGDSEKVSSPYLGHINLGKRGYNVPRTGTVQVTLFNPLGTVVKMFVIMYDLSDMPPNSQTFIRQRTLYMPTNCEDSNLEWGPKWLRYLIHLRFMTSKSGRIYLHSDIRMIIFRKCDLDTATAHGIDMCYELRSFTHMPQNPKFSPKK